MKKKILRQKKITMTEYNSKIARIIKMSKGNTIVDTLVELLEEASKYKIIKGEAKKCV